MDTNITHLLNASGIVRREAQLLLSAAWHQPITYLMAHPDALVPAAVVKTFSDNCQQRVKGVPIAYLLEKRAFYSLDFKVTPAVLIPRPETELLVTLALEETPANGRLLDLGCGSGAVALAIKHQRPDITVHASDFSAGALAVAQENAEALKLDVTFYCSDWWQNINGNYDVVVSNPPYIEAADAHLEQGDCRFEPRHALVGGDDGLRCLATIIEGARHQRCAKLFLEHGFNQSAAVRALLTQAHFSGARSWCDLAAIERVSGGYA